MANQAHPLDYSKDSANTGKDRVREMADAATDKAKDVAKSAEDLAGRVTEQAREYGEKAQEAFNNVKPYIDKSLKEQPLVTLGVVAAIAFVIGALWKK